MTDKKQVGAMMDAFRYAPGDGHVYRLAGDYSVITVSRLSTVADGKASVRSMLVEIPTGDTIPAPEARTATALVAAVDAWRWSGGEEA